MKNKAKIIVQRTTSDYYTLILKTQWLLPLFNWYILDTRLVGLSCEQMNQELREWKNKYDVVNIDTIN